MAACWATLSHGVRRKLRTVGVGVLVFALVSGPACTVGDTSAVPVFEQAHINDAMRGVIPPGGGDEQECFVFPAGRDYTTALGPSMALHYLALVAHYRPDATSSSGQPVADQVASCISTFLSEGNEPGAIGYYGWVGPKAAAALALARHNPSVWRRLSTEEHERADWLMKVFAVAGNLTNNAEHECRVGVSLDEGPGNYVPNQRGYASVMSYAYLYFGGAEPVDSLLAEFDFDEYTRAFRQFGWTRLLSLWTRTPETRQLMEGTLEDYADPANPAARCQVTSLGVSAPFSFRGITVVNRDTGARLRAPSTVPYDPFEIFKREEAGYMYGLNVRDKAAERHQGCQVKGRLLGKSRFGGQYGMAYEFNEASGRSSMHYVWSGQHIALTHYSTLVALGYWDWDDARHEAVRDQVWVANEHYFYEAARWGWLQSDGQGRCGAVQAATVVRPDGTVGGLLAWHSGFKEQQRIWEAMFRDRQALTTPHPAPNSPQNRSDARS